MSLVEILLLIIVIAGAAYGGYLFGRAAVFREMQAGENGPGEPRPEARNPLPGPQENYQAPRRTAAPPPASAGGEAASGPGSSGPGGGGAAAPRRTAAPPPARAGLMSGSAEPAKPSGSTGGKPPKARA